MIKDKIDAEEIEKLRNSFFEAEKLIKEVENTHSELIIPAINEFRYVARHLISIISKITVNDSNIDINYELNKSLNHIERAKHDALEASLLFYIEKINTFYKDYRYTPLSSFVNNYSDRLNKVNEIQSSFSMDMNYEKLKSSVDYLYDFNKDLEMSRDRINLNLMKEKRRTFLFLGTFGFGIITLLIAILIFLLTK